MILTTYVFAFWQRAEINNRGYTFLVPIGKTTTQHEEKNDVSFFSSFIIEARHTLTPLALSMLKYIILLILNRLSSLYFTVH